MVTQKPIKKNTSIYYLVRIICKYIIQMKREIMPIDLNEVIQAHSQWKIRLKKAIEIGQCDYSVDDVANEHKCKFGQWLDSPTGKTLPHYDEVVEMHIKFHQEASRILELALQGDKDKALEGMKLGSHFNQLTAKLVNKLADIKELINKRS